MNHSLTLKIDNSAVEERDFFELVSSGSVPEIASNLSSILSKAKNSVCAILSDISATYVNMLAGMKYSRYILVPDVNNKALAPLKGKAIVREMKWSGFDIFIIDDDCAVVVSGKNGSIIKDRGSVANLMAHFRRWFWNEADFELINEVSGVDNGVFDVPQVESDGKVVTDCDGSVSVLTQRCDASSFEGKYHQILDDKVLYFRKIPDVSILKVRGKDSFYVPDLWISFCEVDGDSYVLNYNPASYPTMPEKGSSKLIGIHVDKLEYGTKYKYRQKEAYSKLIEKALKDSNGKDITVLPSVTENVSMTMPLKDYLFFKELESKNPEMLEDRIRSKNPNLLVTNKRACSLEFQINVEIQKHSPKAVKDSIYQEYDNMPRNLSQKKSEIVKLANEEKMEKLSSKVNQIQIPGTIADVAEYNRFVTELNKYIDEFNSRGGEIDESLAEVSSSKKTAKVKTIVKLKESEAKPLPRYGTLYRNGGAYEYVLIDENKVSEAEKEAEVRGWKTISYHLE